MATLPQRIVGEAGHVGDHNALHTRYNELSLDVPAKQFPSTSTGPLAEFYNAVMSYYDGSRSTPVFGVNVQHPDFGATGKNSEAVSNDAPALNAAIDFATKGATVTGRVWMPPLNIDGAGARYYVDTPLKVYQGAYISAYGAEIAPTSRFDFDTYFPADPGSGNPPGWEAQQGIVEGYNPPANTGGRLALGRYNIEGLLINNNLHRHGSIGARFNAQQDSNLRSVRINNMYKYGIVLTGQQAHFWSLSVYGPDPDNCTAADKAVGILLGNDLLDTEHEANSTAAMMYFWGLTTHGCRTHIHVKNGSPYKNFVNNIHVEPSGWGDIVGEPMDVVLLDAGWIVVDGADCTLNRYGTLLHIPDTAAAGNAGAELRSVFGSGASPTVHSDTLLLNDEFRGHVIKMWGDTRNSASVEGGVRRVDRLTIPSGADGTYPRVHVWTILHDEGGFTSFGSYNSETADAEQRPLLRMRPGATQMGNLVSWYDKAGVERHLITADGMPKLPGYTAATKPSAVGREAVLIYDLDTNKVQVSDGATWIGLH